MLDGADLHLHTSFSDGKLTPADLLARVHKAGLRAIAITDHDTMEGVAAAQEEGRKLGVSVLAGVELSVRLFTREVHMLGYGVALDHPSFAPLLAHYRDLRSERARGMAAKLTDLGYPLSFEAIKAVSGAGAIGRPHVAQALVDAGHVRSIDEAFSRLIGDNGPAFQSRRLPRASEAIQRVHEAGGIAVLAHPSHWTSEGEVRHLVEQGMDGIETIHPSHDASLTRYYKTLAVQYSLLETGGSDFHGIRTRDANNLGKYRTSQENWERIQTRLGALETP